jgi:hypothetical protein
MHSACTQHALSMQSSYNQHGLSMDSACTQRAYCSCSACDGNERPVEGEGGSGRRGEHVHAPRSGHQRSLAVLSGH